MPSAVAKFTVTVCVLFGADKFTVKLAVLVPLLPSETATSLIVADRFM